MRDVRFGRCLSMQKALCSFECFHLPLAHFQCAAVAAVDVVAFMMHEPGSVDIEDVREPRSGLFVSLYFMYVQDLVAVCQT